MSAPQTEMLDVRFGREADGRWVAEIEALPGAIAGGATKDEAQRKVLALALRVAADRLDQGQEIPLILTKAFKEGEEIAPLTNKAFMARITEINARPGVKMDLETADLIRASLEEHGEDISMEELRRQTADR